MAEQFRADLKGLKEVDERLASLGQLAGEKVMHSTMFVAMKPVMEAARTNATAIQRSGALAKSIRRVFLKSAAGAFQALTRTASRFIVSVAQKIRDQTAIALANLVYRPRRPRRGIFWGHLVEWGFTHVNSGRRIAGRGIFRRALESNASRVVEIFRQRMGPAIDRAAKKQSAA